MGLQISLKVVDAQPICGSLPCMLSPLDHVLTFDLETVPDLPCVARVNGFDEDAEDAAREKLGDKFPKLIFHRIVVIGALIAERVGGSWIVRSLGAPSIADRT